MDEFEKFYDGHTIEPIMQQYWEDNHVYSYTYDKSRPLYSIDTPPPTVSGTLHIGHIFSYTQAEIIARYRRMRGYNVYYPFGFDDNGLPSERLVERETGISAHNVPRSEFCGKCIDITKRYEADFMALWKSLGFSCDWNLQYSTSSLSTQRLSQESFIKLAHAGHAYHKESPVLWCTECQTSIAQAELDSREINSAFITFCLLLLIPLTFGRHPRRIRPSVPISFGQAWRLKHCKDSWSGILCQEKC